MQDDVRQREWQAPCRGLRSLLRREFIRVNYVAGVRCTRVATKQSSNQSSRMKLLSFAVPRLLSASDRNGLFPSSKSATSGSILKESRDWRAVLLYLVETAPKRRSDAIRPRGNWARTAAARRDFIARADFSRRRMVAHRRGRGRGGAACGTGSPAQMIHLPPSVRVYLCMVACDMRRSFDGLAALMRKRMEPDPHGCHL